MHSATFTSPVGFLPQLDPNENSRVSALSFFSDDIWDFSTEVGDTSLPLTKKVIRWKFETAKGHHSFDPEYWLMLLALKELAYWLLFGPNQNKPVTVAAWFIRLKMFVRFLAERPCPPFRFQDVLESDVKDYIEYLKTRPGKNGTVSPRSLCSHLDALNLLYDNKDRLSDYLRFRPSGNKPPYKAVGLRKLDIEQNRTQPIPDNELKALIDAALNYMQNRAPLIFKCLEEFNLFAETANLKSKSRDQRRYQWYKYFFAKREDFRSSDELNTELIHLRTACFIVIASSTGMRISEILAIKRGCIRQEPTSNHGIFYWIDSKLFKTQRKDTGSDRSWMCGPLTAQAVAVLEKMGSLLGAHSRTPYLFFSFKHFVTVLMSKGSRVKILLQTQIGVDLRKFCFAHGLNIKLHAHQFRRSFARSIIRFSSTSILALKDHFKHWSLYMTDWYVGLDPELIADLEAERLLLSIEATEKICTQTVSGAGGRKWTQELDRRVREGKLPRNFRGKAGLEFRKKIIQSLHDSGMIVT
ncbi:MAG: site-specific integrase, partial [Nitrososphaera sp.]|nr:site-specific integrase [Nitrososphaera sp.]